MALEATQLAGWIDGEHPIDIAGTDHVAGQPAKLASAGWQLATSPSGALGVFKNDMAVDVVGGPEAGDTVALGFAFGSVLLGVNKVKMTPGALKDGTVQAPFAFPPSGSAWAVGDLLYISATGFWDNAAAVAGDAAFGEVTKAPASAKDSLEAFLFIDVSAEVAGTIPDGSVTTAKLANLAVTAAKIAASTITAAKIAQYFSPTDVTATGSSQTIAHGLGSAPSMVWFEVVAGHDGAGGAGTQYPDITHGAHTGTNIVVTVSAGAKFRAYAIL